MANTPAAPSAPAAPKAKKYVAVGTIITGTKKDGKLTKVTINGGDEVKGLPKETMENLIEKGQVVEG